VGAGSEVDTSMAFDTVFTDPVSSFTDPVSSASPRHPGVRALGLAHAFGRLPPTALLLLSILSVQLGSALATMLFSGLGPAGTALASTAFGAAVLTLLSPPRLDARLRTKALLILVFGLADACMALPFFLSRNTSP